MEATPDELNGWVEGLRSSGLLIIVEGRKDKAALAKLGMRRVKTLDGALFEVVEEVAAGEKRAVILTDLDAEGKKLYGRLKKDLIAHGVQVDRTFREFLQRRTKVSHIEGLDRYIKDRTEGEDG
jgi:5S rRNA maturation endonuclease (ribonuclease M5)